MANCAIVGINWGDEGKGRMVDYLTQRFDVVVRYQGGGNAGHTVVNELGKFALHLLPSGIFRSGVVNILGNGVAVDLENLKSEMDTDVRFVDTDDYNDIYAEMDRVGKELGRPYYKIPCGGSNGLGALGYVSCVQEIAESGMHFDYLCCAEGSGGTHAGVALGARLFMPQTQTIGMMVDTDPFDEITPRIMQEAAALLELDFTPASDSVHLVDMCGPGYAIPSAEGNAAIRMMAENEGLFLDPVYTGKAFAGVIKLAREGKFRPTDNVLFLYSGGAGGLFAIDVDLD